MMMMAGCHEYFYLSAWFNFSFVTETSLRSIRSLSIIGRVTTGDSKWFISLRHRRVRAPSTLFEMNHPPTDSAQSLRWWAQRAPRSLSPVRTGLIQMASKTIHSMVHQLIFSTLITPLLFSLDNRFIESDHGWLLSKHHRTQSKYFLSKTGSESNCQSIHSNNSIVDFCSRRSFEYRSNYDHQYLIRVSGSGSSIDQVSVQ